ncbi:C40 family peptidase [Candidatus Chlorohelix sp.]|uniref:C40 family peptidase n=1 Tax=Candidatus Chlorohelix sp. TaxID=3139201 RepID=UPI003060770F
MNAHLRFLSARNTLLRIASFSLLIILFSLFFQTISPAFAETGLKAGTQAQVSGTNGDGVRLREQPSSESGTISMLGETWRVTILGGTFTDSKGNTFYKVEWTGKTGYIMTQYLSRAGTGGIAPGSQVRVSGTGGDGVNMRAQPTADSTLVATLGENWLATVQSGPFKDNQGNSFYKIEWAGKIGYVITDYLIFAGKGTTTASAVPSLKIGGQARVSGTAGEGVRMRQQSNPLSGTLAILGETWLVTVLGGPFNDSQGNSYFRVEWTGSVGYISSKYLTTASNNAVAGTGGFMRISNTGGDPIRFRTGTGKQFAENGYVYEGQVLKLLAGPFKDSAGTTWYKLDRNGEVGYVDGAFLQRTNSAATVVTTSPKLEVKAIPAPPTNGSLGSRITDYALKFVGYRYIYAGSSPDIGFDCSGFVYWVMTQVAGVNPGRSAASNLAAGVAVPKDSLQPGDILIFANTYMPGPSHTGIYIGGGRFVHAENESSGVTIDYLNDSYYGPRFYAARRVGV